MNPDVQFLEEARAQFRSYKTMAERALDQIDDQGFFDIPFPDGNSIAIIVKHMAGNMISRWTNFLTTDGEKPDRQRDDEFEMSATWTRKDAMEYWEQGWQCTFTALDSLSQADLGKTITIRSEPLGVVKAISRQMTHYAYHIGQIVLLARSLRGLEWESLSIPRGQSESFNKSHREKSIR